MYVRYSLTSSDCGKCACSIACSVVAQQREHARRIDLVEISQAGAKVFASDALREKVSGNVIRHVVFQHHQRIQHDRVVVIVDRAGD